MGLFAAAAVIAYAVRPASRGPVSQHLLAGKLSAEGPERPSVDVECGPDGSVALWRNGLEGLTTDDAVSLAVNVRGFDVEIIERKALSRSSSTMAEPVDSALFTLDFLGREHYHIIYKIDDEVAAVFTINVRPGMRRHVTFDR
ncbi:MAG: hypothetical protein HDS92_02255 [Bacteroidales bacterium]|nr:hypothetical protein [Bacteroidales bacterium]